MKSDKPADIEALIENLNSLTANERTIRELGEARRIEAIPFFIRALEDDLCRAAAEEALLKLGSYARAGLMETALAPSPAAQGESPSSLCRRRTALDLLAKMLLPRHCWKMLRPCLEDNDAGIVTAAMRIAMKPGCGGLEDRRLAVHRLLTLLSSADSSVQEQIVNSLVSHYKDVRAFLEEEFLQRQRGGNPKNGSDPMIPILLRISRLADEKHSKKLEKRSGNPE